MKKRFGATKTEKNACMCVRECMSACVCECSSGESHESGIFHGNIVSSVLSHSQTENEFKQRLERWASWVGFLNFYFIYILNCCLQT